jgi:hypothetical protein
MAELPYAVYEPQLTPIDWGPDIWVVEGPLIDYRVNGLSIPCPTRMTVVRLNDGGLWLHSPVAYSPALGEAVARLGRVSEIVAPNSYHYLHVGAWAKAHPDARIYATSTHDGTLSPHRLLSADNAEKGFWAGALEWHLVELGGFREALFFHRPSCTLIVTDLMQNFEPSRIASGFTRAVLRAARATGPCMCPSIELWPARARNKTNLREGVRQMLAWNPEKIIISHGKCVARNARSEIETAFRFLDFLP